MKKVNNVGFTLIELLVVVLIIGILAAVALPQYTKAVEKSRAAEAMQILGDIATAESIYYMSNNKYTTSLGDLDLTFGTATGNTYSTNSWTITLAYDGDNTEAATGHTAKDNAIKVTATRDDGTYATGTLTIKVDKNGAISKGGTLSGNTTDNVTTDTLPELAPQWK